MVGVDFSEPTIQRARSAVAALGLANVELAVGDTHDLDVATLGGPFEWVSSPFFGLGIAQAHDGMTAEAHVTASEGVTEVAALRRPDLDVSGWPFLLSLHT